MPNALTLKQEQFLRKIADFIAEKGHAPTIREAQQLGKFASSRSATQYLDALQAAGYVERGKGARALRVLIDPRDARPARKAPKRRRSARAAQPSPGRASRALLVDATDLDGWANRRDAQSMLPQLVRRLIFATTERSGRVAFGSGESVQYPGWDGVTDFDARSSFVPSGSAGWELGTSSDITTKATADYRSRTDDPLHLDRASSTFIFVTPRRWPGKVAWANGRRAENVWRDVHAYDADDLESWLELAPSVHAWLSATLGKKPDGAVDLGTHVGDWLAATRPALTADFLLAGRDDAAKEVHKWLQGDSTTLALQAETKDEAVAFFASVLRQLSEADRERHEFRAVVVSTEGAWQHLAQSRDPLILLPTFTPSSVGSAERNGHRIVLALSRSDRSARSPVVVAPINRTEAEKTLEQLGVASNEARSLASLAHRSMMAFRRVCGTTPELLQPSWASPSHGHTLSSVMLIGGWDETREADREIVSRIAGMPYEKLVEQLLRWSSETDPPVRHIGSNWFIVSKEDSWPLLARYVTRDDLRRFHSSAVEVLGTPDPRFDLERDKQWMANVLGHQRRNSHELISGLANTLALMGSREDVTRATAGESAQAVAAAVVRAVLEKASGDHKVWASLSSELPLLAEAAPDRFLEAVDAGLSGAAPVLRQMFTDAPGTSGWLSSSPHTGLLWALERLAWAPEYLGRAATALARLARLDEPRGTLANRPDRSLRQIFLCWHPQTHATLPKRLDVIDRLRKVLPDVAWHLMVGLLPQQQHMSTNHSPAEWREWGEERPHVAHAEYARGIREVFMRLLEDVGWSGGRWTDLIGQLERIPHDDAVKVLDQFAATSIDDFDPSARQQIRAALRESISFHRSHPDANWELTHEDIERMVRLYDLLEPAEPAERCGWLFAPRPALLDGSVIDWKEHQARIKAHRLDAIRALLHSGGLESVLGFAETVECPSDVGFVLSATGEVDADARSLLAQHLAADDPAMAQFARGFAWETVQRRGRAWAHELLERAGPDWAPAQRAELLHCLPYGDEETWRLLDAFDDSTHEAFWRKMQAFSIPDAGLEHCVRNLVRFGRAYAAVDYLASVVHSRAKPAPRPELIADALEAMMCTTPAEGDSIPSHFDLAKLIATLAEEPGGVAIPRIAAIEWQLVPLLHLHDLRPRILHGELARDPEFFAKLVSTVYRGENEEPTAITEEDSARTRAAYALLDSWHSLPATASDGAVDALGLAAWVSTARARLTDAHRREVGDLMIGKVLGASPLGDDGLWPHEGVREVIEQEQSADIERGVAQDVYNSRGVVTRRLDEGGAQERELEARYVGYSRAMTERWPRTAAMLRHIAESYASDAARHDIEVEVRLHTE